MYELITDIAVIAERCHTAAAKRGKDTSGLGCVGYLALELSEYWDAVDNDRRIPDFDETTTKATELSDKNFCALYSEKIHNTITDELADILIVVASWYYTAQQADGSNFKPERSTDVMLLSGAIQFIVERLAELRDLEELRTVVNLKMRYNEIRND